MDSLEVKLMSLLDDAKSKCSTAVEEKDVTVAKLASLEVELAKLVSLQDELASLKTQVEEVTRRAEAAEKDAAEAKEKCFAEEKAEGKKEAELAASEGFAAKREEIIKEFMTSMELIDIRTKDF